MTPSTWWWGGSYDEPSLVLGFKSGGDHHGEEPSAPQRNITVVGLCLALTLSEEITEINPHCQV